MHKCAAPGGYKLCEMLGRGSYGTVYKALERGGDGRPVAIKCVDRRTAVRTKASEDSLVNEIGLLKALRHPNIVELRDFAWDDRYIYLIFEFCRGHDLAALLRRYQRLPEHVGRRLLRQLASALQFLRRYDIAHFDLKPQNILLTSPPPTVALKLADFGFARFLSPGHVTSGYKGTPLYMAPEMLLHNKCMAESDLWSVGVILYECLFGRVPFVADSCAAMVSLMRSVRQVPIPDSLLSKSCVDLLRALLQIDPNVRIGFEDFFRHPFVGILPAMDAQTSAEGQVKIKQAIDADFQGNYPLAVMLYSEGIELLLPYVRRLPPSSEKSKLTADVNRYLERAEHLKRSMRRSSAGPVSMVCGDEESLKSCWPDNRVINACALLINAARSALDDQDYSVALEKYNLVVSSANELLAVTDESHKTDVLRSHLRTWRSEQQFCQRQLEQRRSSEK